MRPAPSGSASPPRPRRSRCAQAGDTGRLLAWLYGPDEDLSPLVAADVDVSAQSTEQIARISTAAGIGGAPRPRAPQDRHRTVAQRRDRRRLAGRVPRGPARPSSRRPRRGRASGPTSPRPTSRVRPRSVSSRQRTRLPACRRCDAGSDADDPAPQQLRRCPAAAAGALRPGPDRHRRVRDRAGRRHRRAGRRPTASGDAAAGPAGERQDHRRRSRRLVRAHLARRRTAPLSGWSRWATATASPGTPATPPRSFWAGGRAPIRGRICMDQFVVELGDTASEPEIGRGGHPVRRRRSRRADRRGLGRLVRHHRLRDRHPDRRPRPTCLHSDAHPGRRPWLSDRRDT